MLSDEEVVREARATVRVLRAHVPCGGAYEFRAYCGAEVCTDCEDHYGLARCYCGWASDGGDGRRQLVEMGETIEADEW